MMFQAKTATMTEGNPSRRKRRRQGRMGEREPSFRMAQARKEAKEVARGAAIAEFSV